MNSSNNLTKNANYIQTEWYCEECKAKHFGNCPKMKVTLTTTSNNLTIEEQFNQILMCYEAYIYGELGHHYPVTNQNKFTRKKAKQQLLALKSKWETEAYKKGYIDGGISQLTNPDGDKR